MSGLGAVNYKTEKHGFITFFLSKLNRLMIPFFIAIPVILVPKLFISQSFDSMARLSPDHIEASYLKYASQILNGGLMLKCGQLWFLPVLLFVSVMNYPLLAFSRRRKSEHDVNFEDFKYY